MYLFVRVGLLIAGLLLAAGPPGIALGDNDKKPDADAARTFEAQLDGYQQEMIERKQERLQRLKLRIATN